MTEKLSKLNNRKVYSVFDDEFKTFGNVLNLDVADLFDYLEKNTQIPENGNVYVASVPEMEEFEIVNKIKKTVYGDMDIQVGYCNGRNSTYNGFEYHKGSEINIAVTDFVLVLGHTWQIENNEFHVGNETLFFVPKGTVIEMFQTTLHLSPCKVNDYGFKDVVILPRGTNTPLSEKPSNPEGEDVLLLQRNKWVLAHPEREPLIKQGAHPGFIGENKEVRYS